MFIKKCLYCNNGFQSERENRGKFCSHKCYSNSRKNKPSWNKGKKLSEEHKRKISLTKKERKYPSGMLGKHHSDETKRKISDTHKRIGKKIPSRKGKIPWNKGKFFMKKEQNPNWKGGISTQNHLERTSVKFKDWRNKVFLRDKWICQWCGINGDMQAHHIKVWRDYKKIRYKVSNGITLCPNCHKKTHYKEKQYEQFFQELLKKTVNSGDTLWGNPEPILDGNILEGATHRTRVLIGQ